MPVSSMLRTALARLAASLAVASLAPAALAADLGEIDACIERNVPGTTSVQSLAITAVDRMGSERKLAAKHTWKRMSDGTSRNLIEVEAPPEVRGSAYLIVERKDGEDVFSYLPELGKVRRLQARTISGSLFGTDFSYEDFRHLQSMASSSGRERLADAEVEGRPVYVLEVIPGADSGSDYERIVAFVDRETCVPVRMEFHAPGGSLRKMLTADPASLSREGRGWVARSVAIRDLAQETETRLEIRAIEVDADVPDRLFTVGHLERRR